MQKCIPLPCKRFVYLKLVELWVSAPASLILGYLLYLVCRTKTGGKAIHHWESSRITVLTPTFPLLLPVTETSVGPWPCEHFVQRINICSFCHFERVTQLPQDKVGKHSLRSCLHTGQEHTASTKLKVPSHLQWPSSYTLSFPLFGWQQWAQIIPINLIYWGVWRGTLLYLCTLILKALKRAPIEMGVGHRSRIRKLVGNKMVLSSGLYLVKTKVCLRSIQVALDWHVQMSPWKINQFQHTDFQTFHSGVGGRS